MLVVQISTTPAHGTPVPDEPAAATLILPACAGAAAAVSVEIPSCSVLDPGAPEIVLILLSGTAELRRDGQAALILPAGVTVQVPRGERVSLANLGTAPASLMVIDSPPGFASQLAAWPAA